MTAISSDAFLPADIPEQFNIAAHFVDAPAARHPRKTAIVGEPWAVTYAELLALTNRAGNALLELGVSRGDRVLIVLPDSAEFIASFFGAAKIGAVAVPVNPFARSADHTHYLEDSEPRAATPGVSSTIWDDWIAPVSDALAPAETSSSDSAFMLYTSGSGGTPKAAVHRHADMLVTTCNYAQGVLGLRSEDITFSTSKLFFAYGLGNGMYFPLAFGASALLNPKRPTAARVIEMVSQHRPTIFFSV